MSDYSSGYNFGGAAADSVRVLNHNSKKRVSHWDTNGIGCSPWKQGSKKQEVMDKVRSELALANAQELINVSNS